MSDELAHLNIELYRGSEDELPAPGRDNRFFQISEGGELWNEEDLLEDSGDQWTKTDLNVSELGAESFHTEQVGIGPTGEHTQFVYGGTDEDIQTAFDALPEPRDYQASVYLMGEFEINNIVKPPSYTYINGHSALIYPGSGLSSGDYLIDLRHEDTWDSNDAMQQVFIDGMYIDGKDTSGIDGIRMWGSGAGGQFPQDFEEFRHGMKHVFVRNINGFNALNLGTRRGYYQHISVANCDVSYGINFGSGSGDAVGIDLHVENVTGQAIRCNRGFQHLFRPTAQDCGQGISVGPRQGARIYGGYSEFNDEWGVLIEDGAEDVSIKDTYVIANGQTTDSAAIETNQNSGLFENVYIYDEGTGQTTGIRLTANASDVTISNTIIRDTTTDIDDSGTRTVINGWGQNAGDPSTGGDWNGNGREGVQVRDTTNSNNYVYINGSWVAL